MLMNRSVTYWTDHLQTSVAPVQVICCFRLSKTHLSCITIYSLVSHRFHISSPSSSEPSSSSSSSSSSWRSPPMLVHFFIWSFVSEVRGRKGTIPPMLLVQMRDVMREALERLPSQVIFHRGLFWCDLKVRDIRLDEFRSPVVSRILNGEIQSLRWVSSSSSLSCYCCYLFLLLCLSFFTVLTLFLIELIFAPGWCRLFHLDSSSWTECLTVKDI